MVGDKNAHHVRDYVERILRMRSLGMPRILDSCGIEVLLLKNRYFKMEHFSAEVRSEMLLPRNLCATYFVTFSYISLSFTCCRG